MPRPRLVHRATPFRQPADPFFRLPPVGEWIPLDSQYLSIHDCQRTARTIIMRCSDAVVLIDEPRPNHWQLWGYRMTEEDLKNAVRGTWPMPDWAKETD